MSGSDISGSKLLQIFGVGILLGIPTDALRAFVAVQLWGWFVTPLGVPPLGFFQAWGLVVFIGFIRSSYRSERSAKPMEHVLKLVAHSVTASLVAWGSGAIITAVAA